MATSPVFQRSSELWPVHVSSGHLVNEDLGATRMPQGVDLSLWVLGRSAHAGAADLGRPYSWLYSIPGTVVSVTSCDMGLRGWLGVAGRPGKLVCETRLWSLAALETERGPR